MYGSAGSTAVCSAACTAFCGAASGTSVRAPSAFACGVLTLPGEESDADGGDGRFTSAVGASAVGSEADSGRFEESPLALFLCRAFRWSLNTSCSPPRFFLRVRAQSLRLSLRIDRRRAGRDGEVQGMRGSGWGCVHGAAEAAAVVSVPRLRRSSSNSAASLSSALMNSAMILARVRSAMEAR